MPGPSVPSPRADPRRIVGPRPFAARLIAVFPRPTACRSRTAAPSPARRPIPDRFSSPPIVASPPVAETHTKGRNLTYSACLCPDGCHLFSAVWAGIVVGLKPPPCLGASARRSTSGRSACAPSRDRSRRRSSARGKSPRGHPNNKSDRAGARAPRRSVAAAGSRARSRSRAGPASHGAFWRFLCAGFASPRPPAAAMRRRHRDDARKSPPHWLPTRDLQRLTAGERRLSAGTRSASA